IPIKYKQTYSPNENIPSRLTSIKFCCKLFDNIK
ncbi:unnamed protein product, partial [Rotaria sp. Silwood2]